MGSFISPNGWAMKTNNELKLSEDVISDCNSSSSDYNNQVDILPLR